VVDNLNFTHLLEPEEVDPSQELLQRMSHFLVIFVSSEAERQFILSTPNRFKVNEHTICWILTEKHLGLAVPGTAMAEVWRIIQQHPANNLAYAFYALIPKEALYDDRSKPSIGYLHLQMRTEAGRKSRLNEVLKAAFDEVKRSQSPPPRWAGKVLDDLRRSAIGQIPRWLLGSP
jgi:hypothetical protein